VYVAKRLPSNYAGDTARSIATNIGTP
jgi:hypothetical protein